MSELLLRYAVHARGSGPFAVEASELVRVVDDGASLLAVLATASESGWEVYWGAGQRLLLDAFAAARVDTLDAVFEAAARNFCQRAPALIEEWLEDYHHPVAQAAALVIEGERARLAWIGVHAVARVRDGAIVRSSAHTLGNERPEARGTRFADTVMRVIDARGQALDAMDLELRPGDRLIMQDGRAHAVITDAELAQPGRPEDVARALVDVGIERGPMTYSACCVIAIEAQRAAPP